MKRSENEYHIHPQNMYQSQIDGKYQKSIENSNLFIYYQFISFFL